MPLTQAQIDSLKAKTAALSTDVNALVADVSPPPPPPPPPPPTGTSADGAMSPPDASIIDASAAVWTLGPNTVPGTGGKPILKNGAQFAGGYGVLLGYKDGRVWTQNALGNWYRAESAGWTQLPPPNFNSGNGGGGTPLPPPPPPVVAGLIPALGQHKETTQYNRGPADWIDPSKLPAPMPWRVYADEANNIIAPSLNGQRPKDMKKLHLCGNTNILDGAIPILRNGVHEQFIPKAGTDVMLTIVPALLRAPPPTGPRGVGLVSPYITWHGHVTIKPAPLQQDTSVNKRMPLYLGIREDGMMQMLRTDGSILDFGMVRGTKGATDFTYYLPLDSTGKPTNPISNQFFFVADRFNGRILFVDRTAAVAARHLPIEEDPALWIVRPFVTGLESVGSVRCVDDGTMYICEDASNADNTLTGRGGVYQIKGADVAAKIVGMRTGSSPAPFTSPTKIFNIPSAFFCDYFSDQKLVVVSKNAEVFICDPIAKTVSANLNPGPLHFGFGDFLTVSVDRAGTFGPKDEFTVIRDVGGSNTDLWQFRNGGTTIVNPFGSDVGSCSVGVTHHCHDPYGHYPWVASYHPDQGVFMGQGMSNAVPALIRDTLPADPPEGPYNNALFAQGHAILRCGTTAAYQAAHGTYARPSFSSLMDEFGWSCLGCTADYIAQMSFADQVKFIQGGMIGSFPRPEIAGYDLKCVMYFMFWSSQRLLLEGGVAFTAALDAFFGPVTATPPPTLPDVTYESILIRLRSVVSGTNLIVQGEDLSENPKTIPADLKCQIVIDEGMPSEWRSGQIGAPWKIPKPTLPAGPHVTTTRTSNYPNVFSCQNII